MSAETSFVRYLTHPDVIIEPEKPVPEWSLSTAGRARAETFARAEVLLKTALIISSAERKAIETAEIIGGRLGLGFEIRPNMHENDRSATGICRRQSSRRLPMNSLPTRMSACAGGSAR